MALTIVAAMFAEYCDEPFTIEPVKIIYEDDKKETITPVLDMYALNPKPYGRRYTLLGGP